MISLALVERELRVALRKLDPRRKRLRTVGWAVGITAFLTLISGLTGDRHVGSTIHNVLLVFGLVALSSVPNRVAGAIAEERRNNTLGILFISGLSAMDIFIGKLFSAMLIAFNDLLVIFPLLALPFVMGGVSFELFVATVCCLPNVLFFILAASLFASTLARDEASAQTWTTLLLIVVCGLAPVVWVGQQWFSGTTGQSEWLALSPAYGVFLLFQKLRGATAHIFWVNWFVTLGWSVVLLGAAAGLLQRIWRSDEAAVRGRALPRWREALELVFNRQRTANRWMIESNPALWVEIADTRPLKLAFAAIGSVVLLWLIGWAAWPAKWPSVANFFITTTLLIFLVQTVQGHAIARRFATTRRDGTFELVLTTPLSPAEFVEGHLEGRCVQFWPVVRLLLLLEFCMALAGFFLRNWTPAALISYALVWLVLALWTMSLRGAGAVRIAWVALNSARVNFAMWNQGGGWTKYWMIYNLWNIARGMRNLDAFPSGSVGELVVVGIIFVLACAIALFSLRRRPIPQLTRLINEFREIVQEPIPEPDDPRYKKWKQPGTERFPWGAAGFQEQVIERNARRRQERAGGAG